MKKLFDLAAAVALLVLVAVGLTACGAPYTSHYTASAMVQSHDSDSTKVSFWTVKGTMVYTLKIKEDDGEISYEAQLESGKMTVYYDCDGTKTEWFTLKGGDSVSASLTDLSEGKGYIIIETDGKCENGKLSFEVK